MKPGEELFEEWWNVHKHDTPPDRAVDVAMVIWDAGRKAENDAIRQYIKDQGTIGSGRDVIIYITADDIEVIRRRVED